MDTLMICEQLNKDMATAAAATEQNNTVFLLSTAIYHDIAQIQEKLGTGTKLLFEPAGISGNELFCFLAGLNVGIIASNQEVFEAASHASTDSIYLGGNVIDNSLYEAASVHGCKSFTATSVADMNKITKLVGNDCQFIVSASTLLEMDSMLSQCVLPPTISVDLRTTDLEALSRLMIKWNVGNIHIGSISSVNEVGELASLLSLLPTPLNPVITLSPSFLDQSMFVATRVLDKIIKDSGEVDLYVDLSVFNELICYMDDTDNISILNGKEEGSQPTTVLGSTYDESDVIAANQSASHLTPGDWIFLSNVSLVCLDDGCDVLLLNKDNRVVSRETYDQEIDNSNSAIRRIPMRIRNNSIMVN